MFARSQSVAGVRYAQPGKAGDLGQDAADRLARSMSNWSEYHWRMFHLHAVIAVLAIAVLSTASLF